MQLVTSIIDFMHCLLSLMGPTFMVEWLLMLLWNNAILYVAIARSPKAQHRTCLQTFSLWRHNQMARQIDMELWRHNRMAQKATWEATCAEFGETSIRINNFRNTMPVHFSSIHELLAFWIELSDQVSMSQEPESKMQQLYGQDSLYGQEGLESQATDIFSTSHLRDQTDTRRSEVTGEPQAADTAHSSTDFFSFSKPRESGQTQMRNQQVCSWFLAHLSRRLEWAIVIAHRPSSVRPSVVRPSVRPA